eukprot:1806000-Pyramimonas_sp.AAC.1
MRAAASEGDRRSTQHVGRRGGRRRAAVGEDCGVPAHARLRRAQRRARAHDCDLLLLTLLRLA